MPISTAFPTTWCTNWWKSARRRPPSRSCTKARAWPRTCAAADVGRPSPLTSIAQEPPRASGMDALAHGALGADHRPAHGATVRADHGRQAAPGDGLSRLSGHHPAGRKVLAAARGSGRRTRAAHRSVPLQKRRIDSEELARSGAPAVTAAMPPRRRTTTSAARSTSTKEPTCYKNR